jgi:hypothetical protein
VTTQPITSQDLDHLEQYIWSYDSMTRRDIENSGYVTPQYYTDAYAEADAELQAALSLLNRLRAHLNLE